MDFKDFESKVKSLLVQEKPEVFQVTVYRSDHRDAWHASAILRGSSKSYTVAGETVEEALDELRRVLDSLYCPHCGRAME